MSLQRNLVSAYVDPYIPPPPPPPPTEVNSITAITRDNVTDVCISVASMSSTPMQSIDWGDGTSGVTATHTYSTPGQYTILIILTDTFDTARILNGVTNMLTIECNFMVATLIPPRMGEGADVDTVIINAPLVTTIRDYFFRYSNVQEMTLNTGVITNTPSRFMDGADIYTDYPATTNPLVANIPNISNLGTYTFGHNRRSAMTINAPDLVTTEAHFLEGDNTAPQQTLLNSLVLNAPLLTDMSSGCLQYRSIRDITLNTPSMTALGRTFLSQCIIGTDNVIISMPYITSSGNDFMFNVTLAINGAHVVIDMPSMSSMGSTPFRAWQTLEGQQIFMELRIATCLISQPFQSIADDSIDLTIVSPTVPTGGEGNLQAISTLRVPGALVDAYKVSTKWKNMADRIVAI